MKREFRHVAGRMLRSVVKEFQAPSVSFSLSGLLFRLLPPPTAALFLYLLLFLALYRAISER